MELVRFSTVSDFVAQTMPLLLAHEAHNNLLLGLCTELAHNPTMFGQEPPVMRAVEADGVIVAVALQTPPNNLILAQAEYPAALHLLATTLAAEGLPLPGVLGPRPIAESFARQWARLRGCQFTPVMDLRIYQLTAVQFPAKLSGHMRSASEADRPLLEAWFRAFHDEAMPQALARDSAQHVTRWLTAPSRALVLWEDGEPVAMAGASGPTPHGIRIAAVYTPPATRRRGYASALVAALSQAQLETGKQFCFLFTDLRNPTSNHIYQQIGYRPVVDMVEFQFSPLN